MLIFFRLPETTLTSVARMVITNNFKTFTYDEPMPYGRVVSDALVQPNGKVTPADSQCARFHP